MEKKLLLLGDSNYTKELILAGQKLGAYVIITDNRSTEESANKLLADEYWDIDVNNLDELEKKCRQEGITDVYAGVHEGCLYNAMLLSERLGFDFYINNEIWSLISNKAEFKKLCKKFNVPVAKDWILTEGMTEKDIEELQMDFPVIVKPIDGSCGLGITVCNSAKEVLEAYKNAKEYSNNIFAEKFFDGTMVTLNYCFDNDGKAHLIVTYDDYKMSVFYTMSRFDDMVRKEISPNLEKLFYETGIRRGFGFIQMMIDEDDNCAVLEMNYRLSGATAAEEVMLTLAEIVLRDSFGMDRLVPEWNLHYFDILLYAKAGTIARIEGVEELKKREDFMFESPWRKPGDVIEDNTGLRQAVTAFYFKASNRERELENINYVLDNIKIVGTNGENLLLRKF